MEIRKFIVELHPDGKMTWCEYEDPDDSIEKTKRRVLLAGYRQALEHLNRQVLDYEHKRYTTYAASVMYNAVASARDEVAAWYKRYCDNL